MANWFWLTVELSALGAVLAGSSSCSRIPGSWRSQKHTAALRPTRYLSDRTMPDVLALIPPPPKAGSPEMARDEAVRRAVLAYRGTARYALAAADANRDQQATERSFQCALGATIGPVETPVLDQLLGRLRLDVRAAAYPAKAHFKRLRPWVANNAPVCTPSERVVRDDGSYPSARGAVGWAYALILGDVNPARRSIILQRGREFGESRVICDAEWQSDVDAGRTLANAVVSTVRKIPQFRSDMVSAREEVMKEISRDRGPHCAFERRVLASN